MTESRWPDLMRKLSSSIIKKHSTWECYACCYVFFFFCWLLVVGRVHRLLFFSLFATIRGWTQCGETFSYCMGFSHSTLLNNNFPFISSIRVPVYTVFFFSRLCSLFASHTPCSLLRSSFCRLAVFMLSWPPWAWCGQCSVRRMRLISRRQA